MDRRISVTIPYTNAFPPAQKKTQKKKKYPKKLFELLEDLNLLEDCNLCKIERYDNIFS